MKIKKTITYSLLALQLLTAISPSTVVAQQINSSIPEITSLISPRVDYIDWQYKMIENTLYRRLYNYSTKTPLSDWEIVP